MFCNDAMAGNWTALSERLDRSGSLTQWASTEAALAGLGSVADLVVATARGADPDRSDAIVGSLVRLAAADGAGDDDALLVLLHLLSDMVTAMAAQFADLSPDVMQVIVSELACAIRSYPWQRRSRAWAANLRMATRRAVLADYRPWVRRHPECVEQCVDPGEADWASLMPRDPTAEPDQVEDIDAGDMLRWAGRVGLDRAGLALLVATEQARAHSQATQDARVAAEHGISVTTLYRRRRATLRELREAKDYYLATVA